MDPLLNPLRFAVRRGGANLDTVKDLERTLSRGAHAVLSQTDLPASTREVVAEVLPWIEGLDQASPAQRRERVERILRRLEAVAKTDPGRSAGRPTDRRAAVASPRGGPEPAPHDPRSRRDPALAPRPQPELARPAPRGATPIGRAESSGGGAPPVLHAPPGDGATEESSPKVGPMALFEAAPSVVPAATGRRIKMARAAPESRLEEIIGVGPKTAERFAAKGFRTAQDLLFFVPRQYEDRSRFTPIAEVMPGAPATVRGEIAAARVRPTGRCKRVLELAVADGTGVMSCRFFRFPSRMETRYPRGTEVVVSGPVTAWGAQRQMVHPDLERIEDQVVTPAGILPVYGEVDGVSPKAVRRIIQGLAEAIGDRVQDILPPWILDTYALPSLSAAIQRVHLPQTATDHGAVEQMRSRLVFDELLLLQLALDRTRRRREEEPGLSHAVPESLDGLAEELLPFALTGAQRRAFGEIAEDLAASRPMNRLLQGDVGSGKTAVALLASAAVCRSGRQAAILAPTEILADQHFASATKVLGAAGLVIARLTGSAGTKSRRHLLTTLRQGQVDVVVGTHALLEPDVVFADLGLAVVDEQHRFGVHQRAALRGKRGDATPDLLVMTATPIPRTLTLTAYGDLRVSVIDELPPGRSPTVTEVFSANDSELALDHVGRALDEGRQAYIVYPLVDASEKLDLTAATEAVVDLQAKFQPHEVGLLHGRLKSDEKAAVMKRFKEGELGVLVSTTVIEVGVDVPNATVMLVQHADRFGLSQLHQLRGRVGRGRYRGTCLLVAKDASRDGWARLQVLAETNDGFVVAQRDLELRGPGELLGTRQSGLPDLVVTDLARDGQIIEQARRAAGEVRARDPDLSSPQHARLAAELDRRFGHRMKLTDAG